MTQPERDAMRALYGELKEAGYIDGLLFADNMVWSAHLTANGRKQASWVRFAWTKVIYVAKHLTSFLGGGVGGALILTLAYLATHPNVADSIVHAM